MSGVFDACRDKSVKDVHCLTKYIVDTANGVGMYIANAEGLGPSVPHVHEIYPLYSNNCVSKKTEQEYHHIE